MTGKRLIYTLGTSTRSLGEFLDILRSREIAVVCDVRSFPTSRRYPYFSSHALAAALEEEGISYRWLGPSLGGYRKGGYQAYTETPQFATGIGELEGYASHAPAAVVCAERLPWRCHRRFIAAALEEKGWEVIHIIEAGRDWVPSGRKQRLPLE